MRYSTTVLLLVGALLLSLGCPAWAVTFSATVIDANGPPKIWGKGVGDLNGDGRPDLVVGSKVGGLFWYENPSWTKRTISATAEIEEDMAIADLDRDGRRDIIAVTARGLTWFRNTRDGWRRSILVTGPNLHDVIVSDLDDDGELDLAGRNQGPSGNILYLWRQVSLTEWARTTIALPTGGEGLTRADIDRDGKGDLVIGKYWFRNTSQVGSLSFTQYLYNQAASVDSYVATGDLNGDGRVDIVTSPAEPAGGYHQVLWFEGPTNPYGGWGRRVIQNNVERVTHFVGVADLDVDGDFDVASALTQKAANPQIKFHVNSDGRGTFANPPTIIANTSSHSMKFVRVGSDAGLSLFGADYDTPIRTPVMLYRWAAE
jgi:hypothetical protein